MDYFYTTLSIKRANCEILHAEAKKMIKKVISTEKDKIFHVCEAFYR